MGIINLVTTGAKTGLGFYKTEAKCFFYAGTLAAQVTDTLVNAVTFRGVPTLSPAVPPSDVPRTYEGMQIVIYGGTQDSQTLVIPASSRCTIARYILVGQLTAAANVNAITITIRGGRGSIGGDDDLGTNGFASKAAISANTVNVRFGNIAGTMVGMPSDTTLSSIAAGGVLGTDTVLTVAATTAAVPAGTSVFIGIQSEYHLARLSGCTSTATLTADVPMDIVPTTYQPPNCPPDTTRQLSTLSAYYGGVVDDNGDSGCSTECGIAGGCDVANGKFGSSTCNNNWGSGRALQDPSAKWRVVAMTASGNEFRAYVDGLHDGCASASGPCSIVPPISITGTAVALNSFRVGLMDSQNSAAADFATMDVAEMMVYNRALTTQELDRLGNYLASKFDLPHFRLNDDARSPTRTVALSRFLGCSSNLRRRETGRLCDGIPASACVIGPTQVTLSSGADSADSYYVGRRLTVTGGGTSTDNSGFKSAEGQNCLITGYVGATKVATCDFSSLGSSYVLWSGANYPPAPGYEAVTAFDATLKVAWAPSIPTPYYALIGDPNRPRAVVRVTAAVVVGTTYQLTVQHGLGSTIRSPVATADAARYDAHPANTITYAQSYVAGDTASVPTFGLTVGLPGATSFLAGNIGAYAPTAVGSVSNWRAQLSAPGSATSFQTATTEPVQVVSSSAVTFTVAAALAVSGVGTTTVTLTADTPYDEVPANTFLQLGDLTSGEVVTASSCTAIAFTGSGSTKACTIKRWWPASAQTPIAIGTKATRVTYTQPSTPPIISFTITTALTAAAASITYTADTAFSATSLVVGDVLLIGSEALLVDGVCTATVCAVVRGQSMAQWGASTTATNSATETVAAAASVGAKAYLVSRAKGLALSDALDQATLTFTVANTAGLLSTDAVITMTSQSPFALSLLSAGDLLQVC